IPLGKITSIEGDPGVGKTWLTHAIATAVTLGRGLPECDSFEPGNVLILSAEDGLSDTIKPRLESFGADCECIFAASEPFSLDPKGFNLLSQLIQQCSPKLVIIDPLVAYMGGKVDLHKANETRSIMSQIALLAERYKCAMVAVRHLTKSSRNKIIYRGMGSIDLTAACRSVLLVGCDANNPNERAVVHIKSNLAKLAAPIGYGIEDSKFYWNKESSITAEDILGTENGEVTCIDEAKDFLKELLADEAVEAALEAIAASPMPAAPAEMAATTPAANPFEGLVRSSVRSTRSAACSNGIRAAGRSSSAH
ncbi:MAG: AAA family ATPase, partial [Proteobacteria bacterium]|nr:AAA family ATPase [Pseudomonadota bacterium]